MAVTETYFEHRDRMAVRDQLADELADAATRRHMFPGTIDTPTGTEPEWAVYERGRMLAVVNTERAVRSKPPLGLADVEHVERLCVGHSDYAAKFALYCSELVFDLRPPRQALRSDSQALLDSANEHPWAGA